LDGVSNTQRMGVSAPTILTIWELLREQNERVFRKHERTVQQALHSIQDEARTWAFAGYRDLGRLLPAQLGPSSR
jgi:hypothetical protein